jgi:hypothetical protein
MSRLPEALMEERSELLKRRCKIVMEKSPIESALSNIRNLIRSSGKMEPDKYRKACAAQNMHKKKYADYCAELANIKSRLQEIADIQHRIDAEDQQNQKVTAAPMVIDEVLKIMAEYRAFSGDATRVSSMRLMAAQFADRLELAIKGAIN